MIIITIFFFFYHWATWKALARYIEALISSIQNVTLFGNKVGREVVNENHVGEL